MIIINNNGQCWRKKTSPPRTRTQSCNRIIGFDTKPLNKLDVDLAVNGLSSVTDLLCFALTALHYALGGWVGGGDWG